MLVALHGTKQGAAAAPDDDVAAGDRLSGLQEATHQHEPGADRISCFDAPASPAAPATGDGHVETPLLRCAVGGGDSPREREHGGCDEDGEEAARFHRVRCGELPTITASDVPRMLELREFSAPFRGSSGLRRPCQSVEARRTPAL